MKNVATTIKSLPVSCLTLRHTTGVVSTTDDARYQQVATSHSVDNTGWTTDRPTSATDAYLAVGGPVIKDRESESFKTIFSDDMKRRVASMRQLSL